ncbi:MAG: cell division protein ZapA [Bacteroidales bacterium]|nr:cell division protein ZapA [Bacteroidales bacterium]
MSKDLLNIKVIIAGRPYKMSIVAEQEEAARKAAQLINDTIKEFAHSFEYKDQQDLLAMVALQNAVGKIELEREKNFRDKEMEKKLKEIDEVLSAQLSIE